MKVRCQSGRGIILISFICFTIFTTSFGMVSAEEWSTYRHDNNRSGVTDELLIPPLSLRWTFEPAHAPKAAWMKPAEELQRMHFDSAYHVTAANGMVYFGSSVDNKVYAVSAETGEVVWTFFTEGPVRFAPSIRKDRIYFGSDDGYVYCLRAKDGKPMWRYRAGPSDEKVIGNGRMISLWPVRTSVLVDDGVVYFGAGVFPYEGIYICALKSSDGKVIWKNDTLGDRSHELAFGGISPQSYLAASENVLYVPSGRAMPAAFDRESGRFLYYCSPGGKVGGTWALVTEGELIAGVDLSGTPAKRVYDEKTGKRKGDAYAWFPGIDMVVTPDTAYILSKDGIHAIDRAEYPEANKRLSALRKERQELGTILTDLRGKLSEATDKAAAEGDSDSQVDKITERIDKLAAEEERLLKSLACKWQYLREDLCSLVLTGDTLFAGGKDIVVAVGAETGEEMWNYTIDGLSLGIAVSDGNLFVSTDKGPIYCFEESTTSEAKEIKPDIKPYPKNKQTPVYEAAVQKILQETEINKGYCLVLDCGIGQLASELAKRTELKIIGLESNPKKVERARKSLDAAGLYGSRVVVEQWDISVLPDYFANLIVSDANIAPRKGSAWSAEMLRVLKPCGGVAYMPDTSSWVPMPDDRCEVQESDIENLTMIIRGELEGAGSWRQLYGNPQNTACSDDQLVKAPLGVLWFGEPGPEDMVERHARAESPVSINGRLFIQGQEMIMAYDAYNGTLLWKREIPGAVRVRVDVDGGNLVAAENGVYVAAYDKCHRLDPATGETAKIYEMPASPDGTARRWGYISCVDNILFGSTAAPLKQEYAAYWKRLVKDGEWKLPDDIPSEYINEYKRYFDRYKAKYPVPNEKALAGFQRDGTLWRLMSNFPSWSSQRNPKGTLTARIMAADSIFALDTETGRPLWVHRGNRIANIAATIGDGTIFFAEVSDSEEQRQKALEEKQELAGSGIYEESVEADIEAENTDVRLVVALDIKTGKKLWEKPIDLTGCGGDKAGAAYHDGLLLFFGSFSNHDQGFHKKGELRWRRITALKAENGEVVWSRPLDYRRRPLIVGDTIFIEPRACDLYTGEIKTRSHPITGQPVTWEFLRPGHSCSIVSASPGALFYRSYCVAIYDLLEDRGVSLFGGIRPGCWLSLISANGLLMSPEASSGCTCSFPLRATVVMKPRESKKPKYWTVFVTHGPMTPARHFTVNFGAPGDMKDDEGTLWFGYPRPRTSYGVKFNLNEEIMEGMGYFSQDFRGMSAEGSDRPWLFASGCLGLLRCEVPLINTMWEDNPGVYTVRLGFMAPPGDRVGERVFDVKLQGKVVMRNFDILKVARRPNRAVIRDFDGISVQDKLTIEFVPKALNPTMTQVPMVNFVQVIREDIDEASDTSKVVKSIKKNDAEAKLQAAEAEVASKNYEEALEIYHTVFDAASSVELRRQALEGMAAIGSPKSLSRIAEYCVKSSSNTWDNYIVPVPELRESAIKVYVAIANNMVEVNEQKATRMLDYAATLTGN